jgi:hypothetical protein
MPPVKRYGQNRATISLSVDMLKSIFIFFVTLVFASPAYAEHQEAYLCTYDGEPEEWVIGTSLGVKGNLYYEDLKWTTNGRRLIFSYPERVLREGREKRIFLSWSEKVVKLDQYGREWLGITKTDRGQGTIWLGTGKMVTQYRGPIIRCKVGAYSYPLPKGVQRFMNDSH